LLVRFGGDTANQFVKVVVGGGQDGRGAVCTNLEHRPLTVEFQQRESSRDGRGLARDG
jgi:hypothetical protein